MGSSLRTSSPRAFRLRPWEAFPGATAMASGGPPGGFIIPAGSTASFTNVQFGACNNLSWGYQLNGGPNHVQFTFAGGCGSGSAPDVTIGPFAATTALRVF